MREILENPDGLRGGEVVSVETSCFGRVWKILWKSSRCGALLLDAEWMSSRYHHIRRPLLLIAIVYALKFIFLLDI